MKRLIILALLVVFSNAAPCFAEEQNVSDELRAVFRSHTSLDAGLRAAYQSTRTRWLNHSWDELAASVKDGNGKTEYLPESDPGFARLLVTDHLLLLHGSLLVQLALETDFDPASRKITSLEPVVVIRLNPACRIDAIAPLFPRGSVISRALALEWLQAKIKPSMRPSRIELRYQPIGWFSCPIKGRGYIVDLEFAHQKADTRVLDLFTLGAYDEIKDLGGLISSPVSKVGPTGTRLVAAVGTDILREKGVPPAFMEINTSGTAEELSK